MNNIAASCLLLFIYVLGLFMGSKLDKSENYDNNKINSMVEGEQYVLKADLRCIKKNGLIEILQIDVHYRKDWND